MSRDKDLVFLIASLTNAVIDSGTATAALVGDDKKEALAHLKSMSKKIDDITALLKGWVANEEASVGS